MALARGAVNILSAGGINASESKSCERFTSSKPGKTPAPVKVVGETITILAGDDLTKPFEMHIQEGVQGGGPPLHFHPWDEAFYVIDGQIEVTVAGQSTIVSTGGLRTHPRWVDPCLQEHQPHREKSLAWFPIRVAVSFFAALDQLKVPEDLPRILEISEGFGVTFLLPKSPAASPLD